MAIKDPKDLRFRLVELPRGELFFPDETKKTPVAPKFLDGIEPKKGENRREAFARILTRPENAQFAVAAVNRTWAHFFGRGLVHPIDEFNERNKPSHPELLEQLAKDFIAAGYDLKWLIRTICASNAYQLASQRPQKDPPDGKWLAFMPLKPLSPEQLLDSVLEACGGQNLLKKKMGGEQVARLKERVLRALRTIFEEYEGTIPQGLLMMNNEEFINRFLTAPNGRLSKIAKQWDSAKERLEQIFLSVLSRQPTSQEIEFNLEYLRKHGGKMEAYQDVLWALLNSSEFMFNH